MKQPEFRSVDYSRTTITELMIPSYANFGGKIHGGILLSLMDKVAFACAAKHAGGYCVTVSLNATDFLAPVEVGDLVALHASIHYVGKSSIVVGIRVESENVTTGVKTHTNTSFFTMVAMDDNRNPRTVPGLILESKQDAQNFLEAMKRRQLIKQYRSELEQMLGKEDLEKNLALLEEERCMLIDF